MLCFSTALLLAATCLLVSGETTTTCEGDVVHRLSCENVGVIKIQKALYGREDSETCIEGQANEKISNIECSLAGVVDLVKSRCDGRKVCELSPRDFAQSDPCTGTYKYLQTTYDCIPSIHLITCELSVAQLSCDSEQVISVLNANYGRNDQTTCSYKRPSSQIQKVDCSRPSSKVAESCNGQTSCKIEARNSVFGDPCVGTYKYLEVAYTCLYQ